MAGHQDMYGLGPQTPSRFVVDTAHSGLWSLGLKSGLTPQQPVPISTGTHHKLEINPFEQSYATASRYRPSHVMEAVAHDHAHKRPRIEQLQQSGAGPNKDSSSSTDSNESRESHGSSGTNSTALTLDTPPSDQQLKSPVMDSRSLSTNSGPLLANLDTMPQVMQSNFALQGLNGIDAQAYAEHLARYVKAQSIHANHSSAPLANTMTSPVLSSTSVMVGSSPAHSSSSIASPISASSPLQTEMVPVPAPAISSVQMPDRARQQSPPATKASISTATNAALASASKRAKAGRPRNAAKDEEGDDMTVEEVKRRDFLERNRQAACKSRQKRKAWQANLETEAQRLTESNGQLQALVANLREEVASLRATVAGHAANGCEGARLALRAPRPGDISMAAYVLPSATLDTVQSVMNDIGATDTSIGQHATQSSLARAVVAPHHSRYHQQDTGPIETSSRIQNGAGANPYYDLVAAASATIGRSGEVDLSAYLA